MKKSVLVALVIAATVSTSACAVNPETQRKFERSGCNMTTQFQGCDINKSYEWNERHGHIKDNTYGESQARHGHKHHRDNDESYNDDHGSAGINGKFSGNYVAKFDDGSRSADIHVEDSGVYINGTELRDVNQVGDTLVFQNGSAVYTIKKHGRSTWKDNDSGNRGTIERD